jgi:hypothetical protein
MKTTKEAVKKLMAERPGTDLSLAIAALGKAADHTEAIAIVDYFTPGLNAPRPACFGEEQL